ncbi:MAG TPA: zf-HC2 domain-containing protein [Candidatus Limnocylindrales bacterium]|nr:zf-HC2 domain-containing protein [Candidatus Limnocylindrales bacterium]
MLHADTNDRQFHERYVMNRLSEAERDQFEQHLAGCSECQAAVETAGRMAWALGEVRQEFAVRRATPFWRRRFTAWQAAALAAACFVVALAPGLMWYRDAARAHSVQAALQADASGDRGRVAALESELSLSHGPDAMPIYPLETMRGGGDTGEPVTQVAIPGNSTSVLLAVPRDVVLHSSKAELRDAAGRIVWSLAALPPGESESVGLAIPASVFAPGRYVLTLLGDGHTAGRFAFSVK